MPRWTDAYRLRDWIEAPMEAGLYEIGRVRKALGKDHYVFTPLYLGKSNHSIQGRLRKHYLGIGSQSIAEYRIRVGRDWLYFHTMQTEDYDAMEARLLDRLGIGPDGYYRANRKYEKLPDDDE